MFQRGKHLFLIHTKDVETVAINVALILLL